MIDIIFIKDFFECSFLKIITAISMFMPVKKLRFKLLFEEFVVEFI